MLFRQKLVLGSTTTLRQLRVRLLVSYAVQTETGTWFNYNAEKNVLVMPYTPLFYYDLLANAFQRWNKIRLNNDGLRHNKTVESFSSSHSFKLQCILLESWDVGYSSSAWKLGSRAAALNRENIENKF